MNVIECLREERKHIETTLKEARLQLKIIDRIIAKLELELEFNSETCQ